MPFMKSIMALFALWPAIMPQYMTSSGISFAPASIITILESLETTVTAISDFLRCSLVGFITYSPSIYPIETPDIGPFHGISEMLSAMDVPAMAAISGMQSLSTLITVQTTETSLRMSFGNSGRMGRSISREVSIAFSLGRPSRFIYEPGIFPTEYIFSS